ncbi:MAG: phage holin family protein [Candidatus Goldiibacteriota bacterium]
MVVELRDYNAKALVIKWFLNTFALFLVVKTIKGLEIKADGLEGLVILMAAAAVIAVINVFIKPFVLLLTLPINVLSFGLLTFVINGVMFALAGLLVNGFEVKSFWGAVAGSVFYSILSMILGIFVPDKRNAKPVDYRIIDE